MAAPSNPDNVTLDYVTERRAQVHWSPQPGKMTSNYVTIKAWWRVSISAAIQYRAVLTSSTDKKFRKERNVTTTSVLFGELRSGYFYKFSVYSVGKGNVIDYNVVHPLLVQTGGSCGKINRMLVFHVALCSDMHSNILLIYSRFAMYKLWIDL